MVEKKKVLIEWKCNMCCVLGMTEMIGAVDAITTGTGTVTMIYSRATIAGRNRSGRRGVATAAVEAVAVADGTTMQVRVEPLQFFHFCKPPKNKKSNGVKFDVVKKVFL